MTSVYKPPGERFSFHQPLTAVGDQQQVIIGDFNSHSSTWGYATTNTDGELVEDWAENQMLLLLLSCIIVSDQIVNSVCWSHALVNGPTSKMPASDGGLYIGQLLMMWSAVCSGSPYSHVTQSASPHFFMDALNPSSQSV